MGTRREIGRALTLTLRASARALFSPGGRTGPPQGRAVLSRSARPPVLREARRDIVLPTGAIPMDNSYSTVWLLNY